jgi:hypothetical protein
MAQSSLVNDRVDSGARFLRRFGDIFPIKAAAWMQNGESKLWYLYVASDAIDPMKVGSAYGEVFHAFQDLEDLTFDPFQVKLLRPNDPVARQLLAIRGSLRNTPTVFQSIYVGGELMEEGYIYPEGLTADRP